MINSHIHKISFFQTQKLSPIWQSTFKSHQSLFNNHKQFVILKLFFFLHPFLNIHVKKHIYEGYINHIEYMKIIMKWIIEIVLFRFFDKSPLIVYKYHLMEWLQEKLPLVRLKICRHWKITLDNSRGAYVKMFTFSIYNLKKSIIKKYFVASKFKYLRWEIFCGL